MIAETVTANASSRSANSTDAFNQPATQISPQHPTLTTASLTEFQRLGIHTPESLDSLCAQESRRPFVVDGVFPMGSIGIVVGDSGLGKSPFGYQLGLCVAAGLLWLGMKTRRGTVLYVDLENGSLGSQAIRDSAMNYLQLQKCPDNFFCTQDVTDINSLEKAITAIKPELVVIDTLRSFDASAEETNTTNTKGGAFLKSLRRLSHTYRVSFLLIHHIKKQDKKGFYDAHSNLETDSPMQWLNLACGARTLVNQSDVRIGVDRASKGNVALIV